MTKQDKAREILADYDAGRPLQVKGDGWLIAMSAALIDARTALQSIALCTDDPAIRLIAKEVLYR